MFWIIFAAILIALKNEKKIKSKVNKSTLIRIIKKYIEDRYKFWFRICCLLFGLELYLFLKIDKKLILEKIE